MKTHIQFKSLLDSFMKWYSITEYQSFELLENLGWVVIFTQSLATTFLRVM